jgi:CheY-like chemotaxis protein/HPt (histidine-containing phosphotransfer) domain-containing protein
MLAYKKIESKLAANGMEALQILLSGERFDVILMDYHMPVISGLETIEKIKQLFIQKNETSPLVILHTSSEEHDVINSFRQDENSYFLLKPIKSEELYQTLKRAVQHNVKEISVAAESEMEVSLFPPDLHVLLVDDNPVNMVLNNKMIKSLIPDAQLTEAGNGLEALEQCKSKHFSLILMDVQMPVMDGIEATKQIRLLPGYQDTPIIGVTAGTIIGEKEKCIMSGMNDFLPKPLRQADLLEMLTKYISGNKAENKNAIKTEKYLDLNLLNDQMGEDDEDFRKMFLNLVIQQLSEAENNIKNAAAEENTDELKKILHKLKGTAGTAGLIKLAETALYWEKKGEETKDFSSLKQEITDEITIGLNLIKGIIK